MLIYIAIPIYCFREPERQDTLHSFYKIALYYSIPRRLFNKIRDYEQTTMCRTMLTIFVIMIIFKCLNASPCFEDCFCYDGRFCSIL